MWSAPDVPVSDIEARATVLGGNVTLSDVEAGALDGPAAP